MEKEKKEIFNKILYILIIFSFCCAMIYFKNSIISIVLGAIALLFIFLFNRFNKKYAFFIFLLLTCICIPTNEVKAEELYPVKDIKTAFENLNLIDKPFDRDYFILYDSYNEQKYSVYSCSSIDFYYYFDNDFFHWIASSCKYAKFNNLIYNENGLLIPEGNNFGEFGGVQNSYPLCENMDLCYNTSSFLNTKQNYKFLSASRDIIFRSDTSTTVNSITLYKKEESDINENFGYDLGAVEGYEYISVPPKSQVVLYPKTLKSFDFYLFHKGHLDVDILDSVASNISSSVHYSNVLSNEYTYQYLSYSEEDAINKRGVYLTNFTDNPTIVGYNPDLFKLLNFNENGLAVDTESDMTFSNTYNTIKSQNNIVDSNDKLGSFDDLISNPKNLASQLVGVFQTIGQLVTIFFASMPEFISQGLMLLFVIIIAIAILKALL